jgi:putative tricarboxylic transport membrane protein
MEILQNLQIGFSIALTLENLWFCLIGVFTGTLVGVLPGIGPVGAMALLLPTTFHLSPVGAIIMLAGIYYGAMYGGSTTSILLNIPGEAASVVTCIDGYQMARQGRAGPALGMSAIGSFIGGTASIIGLTLLAPPLSEAALKFGPPEYFSLMVLGLTLLIYMASDSIPKALMMAVMGVILGVVGIDATSGAQRFTFGILDLNDGLDLIPLVMGLFGISEVLLSVEDNVKREIFQTTIKNLLPTREDWKRSLTPIFRGSVLGFSLGILPGGGALISSFASYAMEKKLSKTPERFGKGAIEGVAGPETANNAATGGAFIPLLTLGIPSNVVMAVLLGALMIYGMEPGPMLLKNHPQLFWGAVTSMYIGNAMLLVLNLPLIGIWVQLLKVPYRILFPLILLFCLIGVYSVNYSAFEVQLMIIFGVLGYLMKKFRYEAAPLVLAYVLGPMVEISLRQSLTISNGSFGIFFTRPISLIGIAAAILIIISPILPWIKEKRRILPLKEE